jgi:hypothetical protein
MKFGDFLFPESSDPERDGAIIDDALDKARLCDELCMDAIWPSIILTAIALTSIR